MAIEFGELIRSAFVNVQSNRMLNGIFVSPVAVACILILATIVVMVSLGCDVPHWAQFSVYLFIVFYGVLVVHFSIVDRDFRSAEEQKNKQYIPPSGPMMVGGEAIAPKLARGAHINDAQDEDQDAMHHDATDEEAAQEESLAPEAESLFERYGIDT
jgi:hypothetical protein